MKKTLTRSRTDKILGGVMGGLADYFQVDATILRIIYAVLVLLSNNAFPFIVLYLLAWILIPEAPKIEPKVEAKVDEVSVEASMQEEPAEGAKETSVGPSNGAKVFGTVLLIAGAYILFKNLSAYKHWFIPPVLQPWLKLAGTLLLPAVLIVLGAMLILSHKNERR